MGRVAADSDNGQEGGDKQRKNNSLKPCSLISFHAVIVEAEPSGRYVGVPPRVPPTRSFGAEGLHFAWRQLSPWEFWEAWSKASSSARPSFAKSANEPGLDDLRQNRVAQQHGSQVHPVERRERDKPERVGQGRDRQPGACRDDD
jgi:hypothetical protein